MNPKLARHNARSCNSRVLGIQSAHAATFPTQTPLDRQEKERVEVQTRHRKKKLQMSKDLIDILFQTEKDKEKERLKREKEKLRNLHPNITKIESGKASRTSKNGTSDVQIQEQAGNASRGV